MARTPAAVPATGQPQPPPQPPLQPQPQPTPTPVGAGPHNAGHASNSTASANEQQQQQHKFAASPGDKFWGANDLFSFDSHLHHQHASSYDPTTATTPYAYDAALQPAGPFEPAPASSTTTTGLMAPQQQQQQQQQDPTDLSRLFNTHLSFPPPPPPPAQPSGLLSPSTLSPVPPPSFHGSRGLPPPLGPPGSIPGSAAGSHTQGYYGPTAAGSQNSGSIPNRLKQDPNEEITTIFLAGFPDDITQREFNNFFVFARGFEAASLKFPTTTTTTTATTSSASATSPPAVISPTGAMAGTTGATTDESYFRLGGAFPGPPLPLGSGLPASAGGPPLGTGAGKNRNEQIIGFAKFRTRSDALQARDYLNGRMVDSERGCVLKTEMAKKNLHTKSVRVPPPGAPTSNSVAHSALPLGSTVPVVPAGPAGLGGPSGPGGPGTAGPGGAVPPPHQYHLHHLHRHNERYAYDLWQHLGGPPPPPLSPGLSGGLSPPGLSGGLSGGLSPGVGAVNSLGEAGSHFHLHSHFLGGSAGAGASGGGGGGGSGSGAGGTLTSPLLLPLSSGPVSPLGLGGPLSSSMSLGGSNASSAPVPISSRSTSPSVGGHAGSGFPTGLAAHGSTGLGGGTAQG